MVRNVLQQFPKNYILFRTFPKHQYSYLDLMHVAHKFDNSLIYSNNAIILYRKLKLLFHYLKILFLNINTMKPNITHAHATIYPELRHQGHTS